MKCNAAMAHRGRTERGLSLLEFTLIVIVVGVLMVFVMQRMAELRVHIERAAVERTVAAMRTALALQFARLVVDGRLEEAGAWAGGDALDLLEGGGILDEGLDGADADAIGPGHWHYDGATGELVYRIRYTDALPAGQSEGRWRVVVETNAAGAPQGLELEATEPIAWN